MKVVDKKHVMVALEGIRTFIANYAAARHRAASDNAAYWDVAMEGRKERMDFVRRLCNLISQWGLKYKIGPAFMHYAMAWADGETIAHWCCRCKNSHRRNVYVECVCVCVCVGV